MLDIKTVFSLGAFIAMAGAATLWTFWRFQARGDWPLRLAMMALILVAIKMLVLAHPGLLSPAPATVAIGALGIAAVTCIAQSLRELSQAGGSGERLIGVLSTAVGIFCVFCLVVESHGARIAAAVLIQAGIVAWCLPLLLRRLHQNRSLTVLWSVGLVCAYLIVLLIQAAGSMQLSHLLQMVNPNQMLLQISYGAMVMGNVLFAMVVLGLACGQIAENFRRQAEVDVLTGVHTRRSFFRRAANAFAQPREGQHTPALIMFDLDNFKSVNDLHGHASGDEVLQAFAQILKETAPPRSLIGRFGGEEFCVLLFLPISGEAQYHAKAMCTATRLWRGRAGQGPARMTVSGGLAQSPADGASLDELLVAADRRLYMAKTGGRDRVVTTDIIARDDTLEVFADVMPV